MTNISGAGFSIFKAINSSSFVIYIAQNNQDYLNTIKQLRFFCFNAKILPFPAWDIIPYSRISPSLSITGQRIKTLIEISQPSSIPQVLITSIEAISQYISPLDILSGGIIKLTTSHTYNRQTIIKTLTAFGYKRNSIAKAIGDFAVRGSTIDIISYDNHGYRIYFFDSIIEKIKLFDIKSQLTIKNMENTIIYPISEIILTEEAIKNFQGNYLHLFGINDDVLYHEIIKGSKYAGTEHWLPLFYKKLTNIFDYLPKESLLIENKNLELDLNNYFIYINQSYEARLKSNDKNYQPLKPSMLYLDKYEILNKLKSFKIYEIQNLQLLPKLELAARINNKKTVEILLDYKVNTNKAICIACESISNLERIKSILENYNISSQIVQKYSDVSLNEINLAILPIEYSFETDQVTFFSNKLILGNTIHKETRKTKKNTAKLFQDLVSIEIGDLIVHIEYGIGRFQGLKNLAINNTPHDFIEILYADEDKLYLPVENLEIIYRYGENTQGVSLDKLGSVAWQSRKAKFKEKIKLAATALLRTTAQRFSAIAPILEPIPDHYQKFCSSFPYVITPDQESAINDIIADLKSERPMDRLLCADVGFGKTEVALRAAAIATLGIEKVQVAIIVPTTLLARQHYTTFSQRFKELSISVVQLSKFTPRNQIKKIKENLKAGNIDIIIGTHALLADGINFKNLGLLIIDEEQHFGVTQKEKFKSLKKNIHVLTLSATPIPRTLQMALVNLKSLSIITTPPINRKPVKTQLLPYDALTIREALLKEKKRNGLSFYVTPRVAYLDEIEQQLNKIVPELKVVKAHSALVPSKLDQIMNDFFDHKFDILLSTSIIESGLDIMSANTIIIDHANMFGLAQLYQMRGRVGRSDILAYAYLIISKTHLLSTNTKKRLEIIQSLQTLGSGFNIASHDMDNRGYGNLLGDEQSGHIKEVGIELYQKMLADNIEQLQSEIPNIKQEWSPIINLGISVQIPPSYIVDENLRLSLYRQLADIVDESEYQKFAVNMIDRFGKLPEEVEHLFDIIKIKQLAKKANVAKIEAGEKGLIFSFKDNTINSHVDILNIITTEREFEAKLKPDGKLLFITRSPSNNYDKVNSTKRILSKLF